MTTTADQDALAQRIKAQYKVEVGQIYLDNDKREQGMRRIRVLSVVSKEGKACCANCDRDGRQLGKTLWIRFDRLASNAYTLVGHA